MTYGQVKSYILQLLNQETIAGGTVTENYNCQADYLLRIPHLINDAMMEIATTARKIPAVLDLSEIPPEEFGGKLRYQLPDDFYQFKSGGSLQLTDGRVIRTEVVRMQGGRFLLLPRWAEGQVTVEYWRYPHLFSDTPGELDELDNEPETHPAVAYYAAAQMASHDNAFLYASLYNKYEDKLGKMSGGVWCEYGGVEDVYSGGVPECE